MKRNHILLILLICLQYLWAQSPITYRPGPGANDSTDQGGLNGGKDNWVYQGNALNYADHPGLVALPISNCNQTHCQGFIQFDLTTLPANVDSVFVGFTHTPHTTYCYSGCDADFYFARVTQPWYEQTMNYANKPTFDTAFYGPINIKFPNDFKERKYNITSMYKLWKAGTVPNYGMAVFSKTVTCNNAAVSFTVYSSDDTAASHRPYLLVYPHSTVGTGYSDVSEPMLTLYPNPASTRLTAQVNDAVIGSAYRLSDVTGHVLQTGTLTTENTVLDMTFLAAGVYLFTVEGSTLKTQRVMKQ